MEKFLKKIEKCILLKALASIIRVAIIIITMIFKKIHSKFKIILLFWKSSPEGPTC